MDKQLLDLINDNGFVAAGVGVVVGLYIIGRILPDEDEESVMPKFDNPDAEIAYLEARLAVLRKYKEEKKNKDQILFDLVQAVEGLKAEVSKLKSDTAPLPDVSTIEALINESPVTDGNTESVNENAA